MRPMKPRPGSRLLSLRQASDEFGLPVETLRALVINGALRAVQPPHIRRVFLDRRDLEAAIESWKARGVA